MFLETVFLESFSIAAICEYENLGLSLISSYIFLCVSFQIKAFSSSGGSLLSHTKVAVGCFGIFFDFGKVTFLALNQGQD